MKTLLVFIIFGVVTILGEETNKVYDCLHDFIPAESILDKTNLNKTETACYQFCELKVAGLFDDQNRFLEDHFKVPRPVQTNKANKVNKYLKSHLILEYYNRCNRNKRPVKNLMLKPCSLATCLRDQTEIYFIYETLGFD